MEIFSELKRSALTILLLAGLVWSPWGKGDAFVFSAPPRESVARGEQDYAPIARYLTGATGQQFVYQHPLDWMSYVKSMQAGGYDLVFDGPHFVSWRIVNLEHTPLVRLPGKLKFVAISRDEDEIMELADLAGRKVCAHPPPNLATMTIQAQYSNPIRQPFIRELKGFKRIFDELLRGGCQGAVMPAALYDQFNRGRAAGKTRILFLSSPLPPQAITAGPSIPADIQNVVRAALLAPGGSEATKRLRQRFAADLALQATTREEYRGFERLLSQTYGFGW